MYILYSKVKAKTIVYTLKLHQRHNSYLIYDLAKHKNQISPKIIVSLVPQLKVYS